MMSKHLTLIGVALGLACGCASEQKPKPPGALVGHVVELNNNSAYSWFSEPRAIVQNGKLIVGSVRAVGLYNTGRPNPDWGNIEVSVCDLFTGKVDRTVLDQHFEQDDHDDPAFLELPDHRLMAAYSRHAFERKAFVRISEPNNPLAWSDAIAIQTPGKDSKPFSGDNVTYSNLFRLPNGRIYDFYRGFDYDPNYMFSDDNGLTWQYGGRVLAGKNGYGPYIKYAYDGDRTIHFVATEDHPRNYDNSLYHGVLRDGEIYDSYGKHMAAVSSTTDANIQAWDLTKIFPGDADNVAWMTDIKLDADKHPYVAFTVQKDGRGLPKRQGGFDHRFYYARFNGTAWSVHEMAYAGARLYRGEDDYTGLAALDPRDPDVVYISTNADPVTAAPLISETDRQRHHELFKGRTSDGGIHWTWEAITHDSASENIRPIALSADDGRTILVWMRGSYLNNHGQWTTSIVAEILPGQK